MPAFHTVTPDEIKRVAEQMSRDQQPALWEKIDVLTAQLAESQAREAQLREALVEVGVFLERVTHWQEGLYDLHGAKVEVKTSLALSTDDTALRERLKAERERIAQHFEKQAADYASEYGNDDMGALSFGSGIGGEIKMDYYNGLLEHAEEIRNLGDEA